MRRSRKQHITSLENPIINLTPLIDIVFVILIMFIVIAPLLDLDQVQLASSASEVSRPSTSSDGQDRLVIHVKKDNTIWVNRQAISPTALKRELAFLKQQYPNGKPQLFHDQHAYFGTYQQVKDALEIAGFKEMDVILKPTSG